jgi:aquaporin Z
MRPQIRQGAEKQNTKKLKTKNMALGKRAAAEFIGTFWLGQVLGAIAGAGTVYLIARGREGFDLSAGLASNGYGSHSPGGYDLAACFIAEIVLTLFFLFVILGSTNNTPQSSSLSICLNLRLSEAMRPTANRLP